jgi:hypothetical protein
MYTNEDVGFVQAQDIGSTVMRKDVPLGAIFKFQPSAGFSATNNVYLALGNLPLEIDQYQSRVSFMLKPNIKDEVEKITNASQVSNFDVATSGLNKAGFGTFSLSVKNSERDCTILGGFQFGWHSDEVPGVRNLGTELGKYVSFPNDKINPDDKDSESNLYLCLGASPDLSNVPNAHPDIPVLLMKVTDKNRASAFTFCLKGHKTICVTRGMATLKVMK